MDAKAKDARSDPEEQRTHSDEQEKGSEMESKDPRSNFDKAHALALTTLSSRKGKSYARHYLSRYFPKLINRELQANAREASSFQGQPIVALTPK